MMRRKRFTRTDYRVDQEPCVCCDIWIMDYVDNYQLGPVYSAWRKVLIFDWDELYPDETDEWE